MKCHKIEGGKDNRHRVAKTLLDMFELVTNDMMDDSRYLCSIICCPYIITRLQILTCSLNLCRTLDTSHFPEENECGFVYFRDDNQLFATEEIDSESFPFSNESCVHFPLPEGPLMEKVVFSLQ